MSAFKIISWNVNGIRSIDRKGIFRDFLARENPDVFCIQETRAHPEQLGEILLNPDGYTSVFHSATSRKGYSGVATYFRTKSKNLGAKTGLGIEEFDCEGRVVQTDFDDFVLLNVYFPNGRNSIRVDYKLKFYDALFAHCEKLRQNGRKLVICGDYNTAHNEIDLARPKENVGTTGFLPIERNKMDEIVAMGYVDAFREFHSDSGHYTWWSNQQNSRARNVGWRIDYHFVTQDLMPKVISCTQKPEIMGSDHCPVVLELEL